MTGISLSLTTAIKPAEQFTVDGAEYLLLDLDHLDPDGETEALALLSRFANIATQLDMTTNITKGKELASQLRETRLRVICRMTTLPYDLANKLPISQQAQIIEALQNDLDDTGAGKAGEGEGDGDVTGAPDEADVT